MQLSLALKKHPVVLPEDINYLNIGVVELMESLTYTDISLIHADPPWSYTNNPGGAVNPGIHYDMITDKTISEHLQMAYSVAAKNARLACWCTWPKLGEFWSQFGDGRPWKYVTGGSWHKQSERSGGVGYHWLGRSEPILVYKKGSPPNHWDNLTNAHLSLQGKHSVKPVQWLMKMIERWTEPGDTVLDLYAGLGSMALACHLTDRKYIGAEIDPIRHEEGLSWLANRNCGHQ